MIALNLFRYNPYEFGLDFISLLSFALGSFVTISILILYYNKIPKSKNSITELDNPIYQSKDILLESKSNEANFVIAKKSTSTLVKVLACILILYIVVTPFNKYLRLDYFY